MCYSQACSFIFKIIWCSVSGYLHFREFVVCIWFENIKEEDLRKLANEEQLTGDLIYYFSKDAVIKCTAESPGTDIMMLSPLFISDIIDKTSTSNLLSTTLEQNINVLISDVVFLPFHQRARKHWTFVEIFPKKKVIVHCFKCKKRGLCGKTTKRVNA